MADHLPKYQDSRSFSRFIFSIFADIKKTYKVLNKRILLDFNCICLSKYLCVSDLFNLNY